MNDISVSHAATVDAVATTASETAAYLSWLNDGSYPINVFGKDKSGNEYGVMLAKVSTAHAHIEKLKQTDDYTVIWASVHQLKADALHNKKGSSIKAKASRDEISEYRYLVIDLDNIPKSDEKKVAATDDERASVKGVADKIALALAQYGLPQPLTVYTGNGYLLLYPIRLEHTPANYAIMERLAAVMASTYSTDFCEVDESVMKDPSRIVGVVGTMNRNRAERPEQGRFQKMRAVVGDYPPNEPMDAAAFIAFANTFCKEHDDLDEAFATSVGQVESVASSVALRPMSASETVAIATNADAMNLCMAYLEEKCSEAIDGKWGSNATLRAACECYRFGLSDADAMKCLEWYNANKCIPSWTDAELQRKLTTAKSKVAAKGEFGNRLAICDDDLAWTRTASCEVIVGATPNEQATEVAATPSAATVAATPIADDGLILIDYGTLKRKPIDWLWHRRIAVGKLSLICGDAGCGKSTITLDIAARVSTGAPWPDATEQRAAGSVILVSAEDDPEDTIGPRLDAANADCQKIVGLKAQRVKEKSGKFVERYFSLDDIPMIEATLKRRNDFRLIVIDPISSYYGKANSHNDSEVRGLLAPLAQLAQTYHVAILLVAHPNKGNHSNAANKVGGSVALNAACRASYMTFKDKADEQKRFMLPIKNNLGNDVDGLSYRCVEVEGECGKMSKIEWGGTTKLSADKWIVANEMKTVSKSDSAREWLRQKLVDNGPMLQTELEASAKDVGITEYALREAKKLLGIEPERVGFGGKWQWGLPQAF